MGQMVSDGVVQEQAARSGGIIKNGREILLQARICLSMYFISCYVSNPETWIFRNATGLGECSFHPIDIRICVRLL